MLMLAYYFDDVAVLVSNVTWLFNGSCRAEVDLPQGLWGSLLLAICRGMVEPGSIYELLVKAPYRDKPPGRRKSRRRWLARNNKPAFDERSVRENWVYAGRAVGSRSGGAAQEVRSQSNRARTQDHGS
jgi:hypothetical protein